MNEPAVGWRRVPLWIRLLVGLGVVSAVLAWPIHAYRADSEISGNERAASAALKELTSAQSDFRGNDRDGNLIQDFWTGDVSGLFRLAAGGKPIQLIDAEIAAADALPAFPRTEQAVAYHGYYFVAMRTDETGALYRQDTKGENTNGAQNRNHAKFAFCAYPAKYGVTGRNTFCVNEGNTIFKEDRQGTPREVWPPDDQLKLEYTKIE